MDGADGRENRAEDAAGERCSAEDKEEEERTEKRDCCCAKAMVVDSEWCGRERRRGTAASWSAMASEIE